MFKKDRRVAIRSLFFIAAANIGEKMWTMSDSTSALFIQNPEFCKEAPTIKRKQESQKVVLLGLRNWGTRLKTRENSTKAVQSTELFKKPQKRVLTSLWECGNIKKQSQNRPRGSRGLYGGMRCWGARWNPPLRIPTAVKPPTHARSALDVGRNWLW